MGKKKKGKKKEKKAEVPLIPPEDPLDKLSKEQLAYYTECFRMFDPKHSGFINVDRVINIFEDMTDEKVEVDLIKKLVNQVRIKQVVEIDGALDTLSFNNFLKIANMYLHES